MKIFVTEKIHLTSGKTFPRSTEIITSSDHIFIAQRDFSGTNRVILCRQDFDNFMKGMKLAVDEVTK